MKEAYDQNNMLIVRERVVWSKKEANSQGKMLIVEERQE